ncbi:hypothetical protein MASR2M29_12080 [Spirochaetota bacterium]
MAQPVKNIEKEFLMQEAMKQRNPITMRVGGGKWPVKLILIENNKFTILHDVPLAMLKKGTVCSFYFVLRDQEISFQSIIIEPGENRLVLSMPEKMQKNSARRFSRLSPPKDLSVSFSLEGELYSLDFPTSSAYGTSRAPDPSPDFRASDLKELVSDFDKKALTIGNERSISMFKDKKPSSIEEELAASFGRCFYLPNAQSNIPVIDPFAERTILTREDFIRHFCSKGMEQSRAEYELEMLEQKKSLSGLASELIVPIVFQKYSIGCARIANSDTTKASFDLGMVESFMSFSKIFAWSLKLHGYFKDAPRIAGSFRPQVIDISLGGMQFACNKDALIHAIKEGNPISLKISTQKRSINVAGIIRSSYYGSTEAYHGIEFSMMEPEDFRFLYESLYGRPLKDSDFDSVEGSRISHVLKP